MEKAEKMGIISKDTCRIYKSSFLQNIKGLNLGANIKKLSAAHFVIRQVGVRWSELLKEISLISKEFKGDDPFKEECLIEVSNIIYSFYSSLIKYFSDYADYAQKEGEDEEVIDILDTFMLKTASLAIDLYDFIFGYNAHRKMQTLIYEPDSKTFGSIATTTASQLFGFKKEDFKKSDYSIHKKELSGVYSQLEVYVSDSVDLDTLGIDDEYQLPLYFVGKTKNKKNKNTDNLDYFVCEQSPYYLITTTQEKESDDILVCLLHFIDEISSVEASVVRPKGLDN